MSRQAVLPRSLLPVCQLRIVFYWWAAVVVHEYWAGCDELAPITLNKQADEFDLR